MTNLPTLKDIAAEGAPALKGFSLELLDALTTRADTALAEAQAVKKAITAELTRRFENDIATGYIRERKDTGTIHLERDGYDLAVDRPKRVDWDQEALAKIGDEISAAGDDPHEYVKAAYSVDERKFTAWPAYLQAKFIAARTVKPGATTIRLAKLEPAQ